MRQLAREPSQKDFAPSELLTASAPCDGDSVHEEILIQVLSKAEVELTCALGVERSFDVHHAFETKLVMTGSSSSPTVK